MTEDELRIVRRAYAKHVMAALQADDQRVEQAFAAVRREAFLGAGPWPILRFQRSYVPSPSADPVYLYTDDLVGIVPERQINNGQPSFHAALLACAGLRAGEHVVHVGAGTGYFSAIMAELVGPRGRVTAIELEPELAARARANLAALSQVAVVEGNGATAAFAPADVIYVNAGTTGPAEAWLDRLKDGGRLVLPLTAHRRMVQDPIAIGRGGAVFLITRDGPDFQARYVRPVAIYPCAGLRDDAMERALRVALAGDDIKRVTRLYRTEDVPAERCWLRGPGWCLAYD